MIFSQNTYVSYLWQGCTLLCKIPPVSNLYLSHSRWKYCHISKEIKDYERTQIRYYFGFLQITFFFQVIFLNFCDFKSLKVIFLYSFLLLWIIYTTTNIIVIFFHRYFIDHNTEEDRYFTIDASTGTIKTAKIFDREETPWYNITVAASEIGK